MTRTTGDPTAVNGSRRLRLAVISATSLVAGAAAIVAVFVTIQPGRPPRSHDHDVPITYASTRAMAEKIGCIGSFTAATYRGSSTDAGQCLLSSGTLVQLRVYPLPDEATAWLDGSRAQDQRNAGVSGGTWAAMIGSTDRATINSVVGPLTTTA